MFWINIDVYNCLLLLENTYLIKVFVTVKPHNLIL